MNRKGNIVLFDPGDSYIAPVGCPEDQQIRELMKQVKAKIQLQERNGVFVMPVWIKEMDEATPVFPRQGK